MAVCSLCGRVSAIILVHSFSHFLAQIWLSRGLVGLEGPFQWRDQRIWSRAICTDVITFDLTHQASRAYGPHIVDMLEQCPRS